MDIPIGLLSFILQELGWAGKKVPNPLKANQLFLPAEFSIDLNPGQHDTIQANIRAQVR